MMLVLGDAHGSDPDRRAALHRAYEATDAEVALQVGDLETYDLPVSTWFVAGNNEDLDVVEALRAGERPPGDRRVSNVELLTDVVELGGRRIAGLSGNHAPTQYEKSRAELAGGRRRHFVRDDVERVLQFDDVEVLLCHESPHGLLRTDGYDPGCRPVDRLVRELDPDLCLTGHHHRHAAGTIGGTRVYSLAPAWESYYRLDPQELSLTRHSTPGTTE